MIVRQVQNINAKSPKREGTKPFIVLVQASSTQSGDKLLTFDDFTRKRQEDVSASVF
jgi:hypothetical protein